MSGGSTEQLYMRWIEKCTDAELLSELESIRDQPDAISDRFYCGLSFGTGGLRGEIGAGENRMNIYTIGKATQGLAEYLKEIAGHPLVAIAHDNRRNSDVFAKRAAAILAENGIRVFMYPVLTPTPMLSYAVRYYHANAGIVITASHNPAVYNGYKVYGPDGCQITDTAAEKIERHIASADIFDDVRTCDFEQAVSEGKIVYIDNGCNESYYRMIEALAPGNAEDAGKLSIVYTPLCGTGRVPVLTALKRAGFENITCVQEQLMPDPAFTTCPYPNPEVREALEYGIRELERTGADILLATDPDCDRMGAAVKDGGKIRLITGNEMGTLLFDYICRSRELNGTMPKNPVAVKTIVTTDQARAIAGHYGVEMREVLTGFKYIGEQIGLLEKAGQKERYIFGFEESYGYLSGTSVRDKDGVNACILACRMAAEYKKNGMTLADALKVLQEKYGCCRQALESIAFRGENGMKEMKRIMNRLRCEPPREIGGMQITVSEDYLKRVRRDTAGGNEEPIGLPVSDVLKYRFGETASLVVRPSGTEPKLKLYYGVRGCTDDEAEKTLTALMKAARALIEAV